MIDPIADMIARIKNASAVRKSEVVLPMSKIKFEIAKILEKEGWLQNVEIIKGDFSRGGKGKSSSFDQLKIVLKYKKSGRPVITSLRRISKPGLRVYARNNHLPKVLNNLGIAIISTSEGMMTNKEAKKKGLGGEVLCEVY